MRSLELAIGRVDFAVNQVRLTGGGTEQLTALEARLLRYLAERPGEAADQGELLQEVWGYQPDTKTRTVFNTVRRLREKVEVDPSNPEHILTIRGAGYCFLAQEQREVRAPTARSAPLPRPSDRFIGREEDIAALNERFSRGDRLVSLLGPGGQGKTRLALEYAARSQREGPTLVVDLVGARAEDIDARVASSLGDRNVDEGLAARPPALVVVDNAEGLTEALGPRLEQWLRTTGHDFLVTSRVVLGVRGESRMHLGPLPHADALGLLTDRTRRIEVALADDDARALLEPLEGMPLLIELVAARLSFVDPSDLRARLRTFLDQQAPSGHADRHATVSAILDDSWRLLSEEGQRALAQVSVFRGGFDLAAAEAVISIPAREPFALVQELTSHCLLRVQRQDGVRYTVHPLVRDVAAEKLTELGDLEATTARHVTHFTTRARQWTQAMLSQGSTGWANARRDLDNYRRAIECASGDELVWLLIAGCSVLASRLPSPVVRGWAERAVAVSSESRRPNALLARSVVLRNAGEPEEAIPDLMEAQELAQEAGDERLLGRVWNELGACALNTDPKEALDWYDKALEVHTRADDRPRIGATCGRIGLAHKMLGDMEEALSWMGRALAIHQEVGSRRNEANTLANIANIQGDPEGLRGALAIAREVDQPSLTASICADLALMIRDHEPDEARALADEARDIYVNMGEHRWAARLENAMAAPA